MLTRIGHLEQMRTTDNPPRLLIQSHKRGSDRKSAQRRHQKNIARTRLSTILSMISFIKIVTLRLN